MPFDEKTLLQSLKLVPKFKNIKDEAGLARRMKGKLLTVPRDIRATGEAIGTTLDKLAKSLSIPSKPPGRTAPPTKSGKRPAPKRPPRGKPRLARPAKRPVPTRPPRGKPSSAGPAKSPGPKKRPAQSRASARLAPLVTEGAVGRASDDRESKA
jgi:hypothetical protein